MAGRHVASGLPSTPLPPSRRGAQAGQHVAAPRTFLGTPISIEGVRDSIASASLLGSSIPKGPLAFTLGVSHGAASYDLTESAADAQQDIGFALAGLDAITKGRALRAVSRNAEGAVPTASRLHVPSPRLLANGRGPLVSVLGLVPGDLARVVSEFERYGYTINRSFVPPRLDPMTRFSYWQMEAPTVIGFIPQEGRQAIIDAFERGTTVWNSVADIGTHPANTPRAGVTY